MTEPLFVLLVGNQLDIYGGPTYGTEYSMENACPTCGTGAEQIGPLRLEPFRLPKAQLFKTLDSEMLVQQDLASKLRSSGVTCLGEAVDARSNEPMKLLQLRPQANLPPFSPDTRGIVRHRPCATCMRDGYYGVPHVPYEFCYAELDDELASKDVLATHERFGTSKLRQPFSDTVFAAPVLLVGSRVAKTLQAAKIRNVELLPVRVGDA